MILLPVLLAAAPALSAVRTVPLGTGPLPLQVHPPVLTGRLSYSAPLPTLPALGSPLSPALALPSLALPAAVPAIPAIPYTTPAVPKTGLLPESLASKAALIEKAVQAPTPLAALEALDTVFLGGKRREEVSWDRFIVNDEGVPVNGRAAVYYKEIRRTVDRLEGRADLSESLGVMDDSYADVWAKLKTIEALSRGRRAGGANTHLERTLTWVDAVLTRGERRTAVHTHRVFFHKAENPRSEIEEGLRRVDSYLDEVLPYFAPGGKAEEALGELDEVVLSFETRGYREIKRALQARGREVSRETKGRVRFVFVDDLARAPANEAAMRRELSAMIARHRRDPEGLGKIIEGVIYSRYVGLLLELDTVEHYLGLGYAVLQSGRELFDADGMYVTELDAVVRSPEGTVTLVEARAARVPLGAEEAERRKILYKLDAYRRHRDLIERTLGAPLRVVFSMDVGWNRDLADYLKAREESLSAEYGFPVSFLFLESGPELKPAKKRRR